MFCIGNLLLRIFSLEGFAKVCPVGLTDSYKYSVLPARCGAQESQRALFILNLLVCLLMLLCFIFVFNLGGGGLNCIPPLPRSLCILPRLYSILFLNCDFFPFNFPPCYLFYFHCSRCVFHINMYCCCCYYCC